MERAYRLILFFWILAFLILLLIAFTVSCKKPNFCWICIEYHYFPSPTNPPLYNKVNMDTIVFCDKSQDEIDIWESKGNINYSFMNGYSWECKKR